MSNKNPPTLPEQLRKLADEIDAASAPTKPKTQQQLADEVLKITRGSTLKERILKRRGEEPEKSDGGDDDSGGGSAHAHRPPQKNKKRPRPCWGSRSAPDISAIGGLFVSGRAQRCCASRCARSIFHADWHPS